VDANSQTYGQTYSQSYGTAAAPVADSSSSYQIELFAPESSTHAASTYSAPSYTTSSAKTHQVAKGETLYRISKLYGVSIADIQAENGLTSTSLSIGQSVRIPGAIIESVNTVSRPIYANTTSGSSYISNHVVEPVPVWNSTGIQTSIASEAVYAVLPKDTLYKISRFTCVGVKDLIARNGISNPDALKPGDHLTLPAGHCLNR